MNLKEKGLTRAQLKYLAITAMVVDHTAWGFVEFMSPLGQIMHLFGRLTLPIMCFFVAEGYRHTSNLKKYILRMAIFALITVIPFYLFFNEEYGYRQNIIFDLLLGLLAVTAMEHKKLPKAARISIVALLFLISAATGGWIIMPMIYILVFYYNKEFKNKAKWFCFFTVLLEIVLSALILLNRQFHFSHYDWTLSQWIYLYGFMLALIPLSFYNNKKGTTHTGKYFFYIFYPAHFVVLFLIKLLIQ